MACNNKIEKKCGKLPKSDSNSMSVKEMVNDYLHRKIKSSYSSDKQTTQTEHWLYLDHLEDIIDFICGRWNGKNGVAEPDYRVDNHQRILRFKKNQYIIKNMAEKLKDTDIQNFSTFEELRDYVDGKREHNYGNTCIYDFALRHGWHRNPRIEPKDYVYVHAHPLTVAKHLSKLGYIKSQVKNTTFRIPFEDFSEDIRQNGMTAMDIEHFLCVYREPLMSLQE